MKKDFEAILDKSLSRLKQKESVESCLRRYPQYAAQLEPLLRTALRVEALKDTEPPSAQAMAARRERFLQEAARLRTERAPAHKLARGPARSRRLMLSMVGAVLIAALLALAALAGFEAPDTLRWLYHWWGALVPQPTMTRPATDTPWPTMTPHEDQTPTATRTLYPAEKDTPTCTPTRTPTFTSAEPTTHRPLLPTHTPMATATPIPELTSTPVPTVTPGLPTDTPVPTATPVPPVHTPHPPEDRGGSQGDRDHGDDDHRGGNNDSGDHGEGHDDDDRGGGSQDSGDHGGSGYDVDDHGDSSQDSGGQDGGNRGGGL